MKLKKYLVKAPRCTDEEINDQKTGFGVISRIGDFPCLPFTCDCKVIRSQLTVGKLDEFSCSH
jgi:hypothetical protein